MAINFLFRTAFAASLRFLVVMFSLSFVSRNFFISLLISSVTYPAHIDTRLFLPAAALPQ